MSIIKNSGNTLHGFTIAGSDGIYVNAKAEIVSKNRVKVYSDRVENPKEVIYAFNNFNCNANLMNSAEFRHHHLEQKQLKKLIQL